jgi:NADPH:quinone reductase-like Zn-dependent oxidoreductase
MKPGKRVLIMGAMGAAGMLATQIAKYLGASAVVGLGRGKDTVEHLKLLGLDSYIDLQEGDQAVIAALQQQGPFDIVLDYLWGHAAELFFAASTGDSFEAAGTDICYVQIGDIAGKEVMLPAESLRSSGLQIMGSGGGGVPQTELFKTVMSVMPKLFELAATGKMTLNTTAVPLKNVERAWTTPTKTRIVFVP